MRDKTGESFARKRKTVGNSERDTEQEIRIVSQCITAQDYVEFSQLELGERAIVKVPAVLAPDRCKYFSDMWITAKDFGRPTRCEIRPLARGKVFAKNGERARAVENVPDVCVPDYQSSAPCRIGRYRSARSRIGCKAQQGCANFRRVREPEIVLFSKCFWLNASEACAQSAIIRGRPR
jgi:hypothetical protein